MRPRQTIIRRIRQTWPAIVNRAEQRGLPPGVARLARESLPKGDLALFGTSSKVTKDAENRAILPAVIYLAGAAAWTNLCTDSTPGCRAGCLGHRSGHLGMPTGRPPQAWKTALRIGSPALFERLARADMVRHAAKARRLGVTPAMRFDGSSDLGDAFRYADLARDLGIQLWDYTKSIGRASTHLGTDGWDVTLSYDGESDWTPYARHLDDGGRVAVVVQTRKGQPVPDTWRGYPAVDGDLSDFRWLDAPGTVVLLRAKGDNRNLERMSRSGFAVSVDA